MIVCKITFNKQEGIDYNTIVDKVLNNGDFIISTNKEVFEIFFSSISEDIDENYIRKQLKKHKIEYLLHVYKYDDKMDLDVYTSQWVMSNLDRQLRIQIEKEQQPKLKEIDRKLDLLDKATGEMAEIRDAYFQELMKIQAQKQAKETPNDTLLDNN